MLPRNSPHADESLGDYVKRLRSSLGLTQQELAASARIHLQSVGKIERGRTVKLNSRSKTAMAAALQVPREYLEAISVVVLRLRLSLNSNFAIAAGLLEHHRIRCGW